MDKKGSIRDVALTLKKNANLNYLPHCHILVNDGRMI